MLTVLLGGARSGKTAYAETLARRCTGQVTYLATSPHIEGDAEHEQRIERHRAGRPPTWTTIEEQLDLAGAITSGAVGADLIVIDCLTLWVNNVLFHGGDEMAALTACDGALAAVARATADVIAVSNEVGLGIVPIAHTSRVYRDTLGRVNQRWVAAADRALLMVAGKAIALQNPDRLHATT
jgi:adenosylcobinamide kinase/adenosylcobinamide-phosphate guanylyltransferase